jgi:hypothetical protein
MTDRELAFAAGLMEGEGSVRINAITKRNLGALIVAMTNTNRQLVDWMNDRWPGYCKPVSGLRPDQRPAWCWVIAANQALSFLTSIEPFVVSQRMKDRIEAARWWQKIKSKHWQHRTEPDYEESFNCWHWMSHLNRRGVIK